MQLPFDRVAAIRSEINESDRLITKAFENRMNASCAMARVKIEKNLPVYDAAREEERLNSVMTGDYAEAKRALYQTIMRESRRQQRLVSAKTIRDAEEDTAGGRGLIGEHLSHSLSSELHALLGTPDYRLWELSSDELPSFLQLGRFSGANVTIPYKTTVFAYCRKVSDAAARIGAVNTLRRESDGSLSGFNTDYLGFAYLMQRLGVPVQGKTVLVLGSGGASKAVQYVLELFGAKTVVISRSGPENYETVYRHTEAELLINTTPVGMYPRECACPVDLKKLPGIRGVIDLIYRPYRTRLLLEAERLDIPCMGGLPMLAAQGVASANIWDGGEEEMPDPRVVEPLIRNLEDRFLNLVLIGMPGSGKSTQARYLNYALRRPNYDTDLAFKYTHLCEPSDYIRQYGEEAYREEETAVVREVGRLTGVIIATGGGAVLRQENRDALRQNGKIIFLRRPLEALSTFNRPLSADKQKLHELEKQRMPIYRELCDVEIPVDESSRQTADKILRILGLTQYAR